MNTLKQNNNLRKVSIVAVAMFCFFLQPGVVSALDGTLRSKVENGKPFIQTESACLSGGALVVTSVEDFPEETVKRFKAHLPKIEAMRKQYEQAAETNKIPWEMFAAIHYREAGNDPNRSPLAGEDLGSSNPDGHGTISSMQQGLKEAAKLLKGLAKMAYKVEIKADGSNTFEELQQIFVAYNRGVRYKDPRYGGPISPDKSPYVMNGFDKDHMNMKWNPPMDTVSGRDSNIGALTIFSLLTGGAAGACDGQLGVGMDGFTFPLKTTQGKIKNNSPRWCYNSQSNCHHTYPAADIFQPTGTPVVAAMPGKVVLAKEGGGSCSIGSRVTIKGAQGDRKVYWYGHMKPGSLQVKTGNTVKAGQQLGVVGSNNDAQCTPKHLHIDMLPSKHNSRISCSYSCPNAGEFINIQPALISAFNNLPR